LDAFEQLAAIAGGVVALALALAWVVRRRQRAARPDLGAFLRRCEQDGTPPEIAAQVFHALQSWRGDGGARFGVRADDELLRVYGIGADEQTEAAALILRRCGRRAEPGRNRPPLSTAADLARYVASCPPDTRA
jgi:hypothetical protein